MLLAQVEFWVLETAEMPCGGKRSDAMIGPPKPLIFLRKMATFEAWRRAYCGW